MKQCLLMENLLGVGCLFCLCIWALNTSLATKKWRNKGFLMQVYAFLDCVNNNIRLLAFTSMTSHVQDPIKSVSHTPYNIPVRNELLFFDRSRWLIKKQRHHLLTKVSIVKVMDFPVVTYKCGSWTIRKAERQRIYAFKLWCWRRLLRVPWTAKRSNQSILKEIKPEYSLEGLMLKLKLQYFGHLMWRTESLEKTLIRGKTEGRRRRRWQDKVVGWYHVFNGHEFELTPGDGEGQGSLVCCNPWGHKELDTT